jgi:hypothetical protein
MAARKKNERKTVLVDKRLQARIILSTSLPMIACLVFATGIELWYRRQVSLGLGSADGTLFGMPEHRLGMLLLFVSASMTLLVSALLLSQKVAGTSYRIRQVLNAFREGDRSARVRLRKGDYQLQLADDLNAFLGWVADAKESGSWSDSGAIAHTPAASSADPARRPAKDRVATEQAPS